MEIVSLVILLVISIFILIKSADLTISSLKELTRELHAKAFAVSAIILAIATSLPEMFVGISSALNGDSSITFGNLVGANILNITFVVGISIILMGKTFAGGRVVHREMLSAGITGALPAILFLDGQISKIDGFLLLSVYLITVRGLFRNKFIEVGRHHLDKVTKKTLIHLILGLGFLILSSNFVVKSVSELASSLGVSTFLIGAIILSFGTTLPELVVSIESLKKGSSQVFFGNILGSLIVNSTLILGLVAIIHPIGSLGSEEYFLSSLLFVITYMIFWIFAHTKDKIEKWEAIILVLIYIVDAVIIFMKR